MTAKTILAFGLVLSLVACGPSRRDRGDDEDPETPDAGSVEDAGTLPDEPDASDPQEPLDAGPDEPDAGSPDPRDAGAPDAATPPVDAGIPTDAGSPTTAGPFANYRFHRAPCGDWVWVVFDATQSFEVAEDTLTSPDGMVVRRTHFETITVEQGQRSYWGFGRQDDLKPAGRYRADFRIAKPNGAVQTWTLQGTAVDDIPRATGPVTLDALRHDAFDGLVATVTTRGAISISSAAVFAGAPACWELSLSTSVDLPRDDTTELEIGGAGLPWGQPAVIVLRGWNRDSRANVYVTFDAVLPP